MLWELSRRRDIMQRLQAEIDEIMHDCRAVPDASVLNRAPYLNAFVKEGNSISRLIGQFLMSLQHSASTALLHRFLSA